MTTHMEWKKVLSEKTLECVLQTVSHIIEDCDKYLSHDEIDELKDCWKIICLLDK